MLLLSSKERQEMGGKARARAVAVFDEQIIIQHYKNNIKIIQERATSTL